MAPKRASKKKPPDPSDERPSDGRTDGGRTGDGRPGDEALGFDEGLARLEGLVAELEGGDLSLEASIERYTVGVDLLKQCHEALAAHRRRVEELTRDAESTLAAFDADPDFADDDADRGEER